MNTGIHIILTEMVDAREFIMAVPTVESVARKWGMTLVKSWETPSSDGKQWLWCGKLPLPKPVPDDRSGVEVTEVKVWANFTVHTFEHTQDIFYDLDLYTELNWKKRHTIGTSEHTVALDFDFYMDDLVATLRRWRGQHRGDLINSMQRWASKVQYNRSPEARDARSS